MISNSNFKDFKRVDDSNITPPQFKTTI